MPCHTMASAPISPLLTPGGAVDTSPTTTPRHSGVGGAPTPAPPYEASPLRRAATSPSKSLGAGLAPAPTLVLGVNIDGQVRASRGVAAASSSRRDCGRYRSLRDRGVLRPSSQPPPLLAPDAVTFSVAALAGISVVAARPTPHVQRLGGRVT